ncbi:universal stress protein [Gordonia sp. zg691]|uniref:Universal stress protein n=1 Tax=Gordonia jinghuaiqii TaxID=2758710 RepID=A0A7D7LXP2_9ACTN|nr:universal stress protein [Gordonia jinghuaiqii]MBD0860494.1 universal stress protein [Gordonia jinghuaiqii]MCR5978237.1 universal stress protein [Gordonia jinghuaiqii]QMT01314.1 universal stress protein [Gordonia jinghuaiqii]
MDVGSISAGSATAPSGRGGNSAGQTLMIAYDGSPNADRAIRYAGQFLRAKTAIVVTAWQPGGMTPARLSTLAGGMQPFIDTQLDAGIDRALEDEAASINKQGVDLAAGCGLSARGSLVEVESTVWGALVAAAEALDVDLLVTGTRGASGLRALLRSSVAERVLKHCHRPVFIVPAKCEQTPPVTL